MTPRTMQMRSAAAFGVAAIAASLIAAACALPRHRVTGVNIPDNTANEPRTDARRPGSTANDPDGRRANDPRRQPLPEPGPMPPYSPPMPDPGRVSAAALAPEPALDLRLVLQGRIDSLVRASKFPGVVLGVALPDGSSYTIAGGYADTTKKEQMRPDARLLLGSVGKTFFSAVALQLVSEGRLDLDAPISQYLGDEPWFSRVPNAQQITVRNLMNHTSGLVRYEFNPKVTQAMTADADKTFTPAERISYILDTAPPFLAGQGWQYSDTNYIVLGMIVEKITGTPYYTLIRRRILEPLKLRNTIPSDRRTLPGVVQGYAGPNNEFGGRDAMWENGKMIVNPQMEWAGGGFASTADDLARWAKTLYGTNTVLKDDIRTQLVTGVPAQGLGRNATYGLGAIIVPTDLGPSYGHSGFFPGYLTEVRYYPEYDFAISIIFNTSAPRVIRPAPATLLQDMARTVAGTLKKRGP
jgi:D-alanyl-D-alanine carboxypeptidase